MEIDVSKCDYYNFGECNRYDFSFSCAKCSDCYYKQLQQANQKLEKIKPILELYANSKVGTLQYDGTYRIDCGGNAMTGSLDNPFGLPSTLTYDPRPAKEGLEIIGD